MSNRVVIAVVGLGHMGSLHLQKFSNIEEVEIAFVCDSNEDRAKEISEKYSCSYVTEYNSIPIDKVQAVIIASDTLTHFDVGKYFLSQGIDVLIEKPIASTVEQARELVSIADSHSCILQIGHLERFNPVFVKLKEALTRPRYFEVKRITPFRGRGADVDVVLDLMIHDLDLLLDLIGEDVIKIDAVGIPVLTPNVDLAQVRLEFVSGIVANLSTSRVALGSERTMRVFQPDEYLHVDFQNRKFKLARKLNDDGPIPQIHFEEENYEQSDALYSQALSFIDSVRKRGKVIVSGLDGLRTLDIAEKVASSIKEAAGKFCE